VTRAAAGPRSGMLLLALLALPVPAAEQVDCAQALDPGVRETLLARELGGLYGAAPDDWRRLHVALAFHVVRTSAGTGGIGRDQLAAALADADAAFAPGRIGFHLVHADTIDDDALYTIESEVELMRLRSMNVVPGALNVYFVESLFYGIFYGFSAYTADPFQGIVMANAATGTPENPATFPHEIAHYFDVLHTFDEVGGPGCTSGEGCRVTGDLVCDTPAEPLVSSITELTPFPDCAYVGAATPPCAGDPPYAPDLTNYMSIGFPQCRDHFTRGQLRRARTTLVLLRPELLLAPGHR
jgi:hypothetical protein